ncbi:putative receptor-like protein kinase At5g39000 [Daucus carota subsp. sativus]|uniref:putative receptor-like protein kinase At5g39000 n=1 Tax=Daucus carota subsp. sativus TaxID=79200 RepID=UPI0007EFBC03|nr:PREDICTED: putative receptor-like protein kinase At5g39000 [Daucus carota subsp. sativus]XP_017223173.1 PREDICTED: putative receptor-like protein kinase At5g39000 [Daucus carota subsp. sativus]XP_017223174.1 PREDICTED: putative receptor-like protein kinase At5g39000 [Daucus carota subsp. sativus]XP_017223175.1 PREDICTED: putative receptor-like protein kinase At5g39000 [Daucus carota subsp. sativus]XP_017223176.1 PREDICTED: putative receptor-like protein kinase At5g39000 [Daucus carota subsp.
MSLAHQWIHTILLILLLHYPIFTAAITSPVDDRINILKKEKRVFGCDNVTLMIVVIVILNIIVYKLCERYEAKYSGRDQMILWPGHICRRFSLAEILCATHNFDDKCLTGKGGSAKVYKGILDNGATTVAIKRLNFTSKQAGRAVFWTEIEMLSKFRHGHLVSLVGYCDEWHEMILVFEYVPGGTLSDHLHKAFEKGYYTLSWIQRLRICIGAAQGLDYLHTGTGIHQRVIHRDVKSTNILLDDKLEAKIADFGISKIVAANQGCTYISTAVRGTFGYMDPAYFSTGRLTRKSDVYAFGVVLFEVLCGRRAVDLSRDDEQSGLAGWMGTKVY